MAAMGGSMGAMSARNPNVDWVALDHAMDESILRFPAATEGLGNQPLEFELLEDGTKLFRARSRRSSTGRSSPAGSSRVGRTTGRSRAADQGRRRRPRAHRRREPPPDGQNREDGVAPLTQDLIMPGETYTYEFTTTERRSACTTHIITAR
jgi:manganese oxidase